MLSRLDSRAKPPSSFEMQSITRVSSTKLYKSMSMTSSINRNGSGPSKESCETPEMAFFGLN